VVARLEHSGRGVITLDPDQIAAISETATPVPLSIPSIEHAGGSVRCTQAEIHLTPR
jgi:hypothetical protein